MKAWGFDSSTLRSQRRGRVVRRRTANPQARVRLPPSLLGSTGPNKQVPRPDSSVAERRPETPQALVRLQFRPHLAALERHGDREVWVTRKGAIRAGVGDVGIIPGSMGTDTYIVEGLGNRDSFNSCSHGAGRVLSRSQARRAITPEELAAEMKGRTWLANRAESLVDEAPSAYKDIEAVVADQKDLVRVLHRLEQRVNYKGC